MSNQLTDVCSWVSLFGDCDGFESVSQRCADDTTHEACEASDWNFSSVVGLIIHAVLKVTDQLLIDGELKSNEGAVCAKEGQRTLIE